MKLIAASIIEKVDTFLHAGYISAYPRPLQAEAYPVGDGGDIPAAEIVHQLDLTEALRLEESVAAAVPGGGTDTALASLGNLGSSEMMIIGALAMTGVLALVYLLKDRFEWRTLGFAQAACALFAMLVLLPHCDEESRPLPDDPPWAGVTLRDYANPQDATVAILHGIIVPAVANVGQGVEILPNVQNEVGLPTTALTEGMEYALLTYGIDGWGKEFRLARSPFSDEDGHDFWNYTVTSAGPDGVFDSGDDIAANFAQANNQDWGWHRNAFYLVKNGDDVQVAFHRWNNKMFEYRNEDQALELTGDGLLDLFIRADFWSGDQIVTIINEAFDEEADGLDYNPIVLQVFDY